jgi:hypothetical protein
VELQLPAVWRSLHEATGTAAWIAICFLTYVAHVSAGAHEVYRRSSDTSAAPVGGAGATA